jgi:hypothetical protein
MQELTLNILGFAPANRDLTVELNDPATGSVVKQGKPFLDGTLKFPKIDPGAYEVVLRHPNIALPVLTRPIRVLPQGPTKISLVLDPTKFRNTPIEDIPDANLGPVQESAKSIAETVLPLANKVPGEAILARDWNQMASMVRDLALAVAELTRLVAPIGHNHPELEKKFGEVSGNFEELINSVTAALAELQRQIQAQRLQKQVDDLLDLPGNQLNEAEKNSLRDRLKAFERASTAPPLQYSRDMRDLSQEIETNLANLLDKNRDNPDFAAKPEVQNIQKTIEIGKEQRSTSYKDELTQNRKFDRAFGGGLNLRRI